MWLGALVVLFIQEKSYFMEDLLRAALFKSPTECPIPLCNKFQIIPPFIEIAVDMLLLSW